MPQETPPAWFWNLPQLEGLQYIRLLSHLHGMLKPRRYLEVGSQTGESLRVAACATVAVDPAFRLTAAAMGAKPSMQLFQTTSDRFFDEHDPTALLGGPVDLAFLDGMHLYEFLLRDFINTERHCRPNSVIVLHDCIPLDPFMARRDPADRGLARFSDLPAEWWAGDVWKTVAILQHFRPDLRINAYTAPPTGLVLITNLDPASQVLSQRYAEAVDLVRNAGGPEFNAYMAKLKPEPTSALDSFFDVSRRYWL